MQGYYWKQKSTGGAEEMKTGNRNKCISVLMSLAMCSMMVPTAAIAADDGAVGGGSSSPTELIQPSDQSENADTGANSVDTIAAQSESTGEAANTMTGKADNEVPAPAAQAGGESTESAIAKVDGTNYASLQAAIDAAKDGETVTLLKDATEDVAIAAGKNITLDLGGKTLTNTNVGKATLTIAKGATATVKNGSIVGGKDFYTIQNNGTATLEGVTATAGNTGSSMLDNWGTLAIESGTYTGGLDTVKNEPNAKLTITGGTFTLTKGNSNGFTGVVFNYGELTISGGEFIQNDQNAPYGQAQVIHTDKSGNAVPSTVITGGTFKNLSTKSTAWTVRATNAAAGATKVSGGAFNKKVLSSYFADGFTCGAKNSDGTYGVATAIAQIGTKRYTSLKDAVYAVKAGSKATIQLLNDTTENVTIGGNRQITLDLNGHILNGSTGQRKPALTINNAKVTVQDSSAVQTGTIMREDTAENSGTSSHYVIDVQGKNGSLLFNGGTVKNNSGAGGTKGASLVRVGGGSAGTQPTVTIAGGTFTQDNFIAIKVDDYGTLNVKGGTINSNNSYAIENWNSATIEDNAIINGNVSSWTYGGRGSNLTISGGTVNGNVESATYDGAEGEAAKVAITGGTVNGTLNTIDYSTGATTDDPAKAAIEVTGGTFKAAVPENYCAAGYAPVANADGTYGVKQAVTVTFNSNQGTAVDSQLVAVGGEVVKPADPTKKGYVFTGWFSDEACSTAYDFANPVDADITLYAGWKKVYTVTFNDAFGTETPVEVVEGQTVTVPANPTHDGYTFVAWYADEECTTKFDASAAVTADATVWAKWSKNAAAGSENKPAAATTDNKAADTKGNLPKTGDAAAIVGVIAASGAIVSALGVAVRRKMNK